MGFLPCDTKNKPPTPALRLKQQEQQVLQTNEHDVYECIHAAQEENYVTKTKKQRGGFPLLN